MFVFKTLLILLCLFSLYVLAVFAVRQEKGIDTPTARGIILTFIKECIYTPPTPAPFVIFTRFIGMDEFGNPHSDIIEQGFRELGNIFKTFHYAGFSNNTNAFAYYFVITESIEEMDEPDLIRYCEKICENIAHRYLHRMNPSSGHVSNIISVDINESVLTVYIAKNSYGLQENHANKQRLRHFYNIESTEKKEEVVVEKWEDKR